LCHNSIPTSKRFSILINKEFKPFACLSFNCTPLYFGIFLEKYCNSPGSGKEEKDVDRQEG